MHASAAVPAISGVAGTGIVAFPASMNSGKSTLVAALVRAGYAYVTDETVAVDPTTLAVTPEPGDFQ